MSKNNGAKSDGEQPTLREQRLARKFEKRDPEMAAALRKPPCQRTLEDDFLIAARLTYWNAKDGRRLETYAG